jgi:hypothetical protein
MPDEGKIPANRLSGEDTNRVAGNARGFCAVQPYVIRRMALRNTTDNNFNYGIKYMI